MSSFIHSEDPFFILKGCKKKIFKGLQNHFKTGITQKLAVFNLGPGILYVVSWFWDSENETEPVLPKTSLKPDPMHTLNHICPKSEHVSIKSYGSTAQPMLNFSYRKREIEVCTNSSFTGNVNQILVGSLVKASYKNQTIKLN